MIKRILSLLIGTTLLCPLATAAEVSELSGPRIGITGLTPGSTSNTIGSNFISQYGWQLETKFSNGEGINGLIEWVILAGGMEQGYFLPSISSLVGLRHASGFEFAVGPNLSLSGIGFVTAAGYNFKSGAFNFPVNISWVPSNDTTWFFESSNEQSGHRISITFGFNMDNRR
tara:strand:- start:194 stop:709 length:516 start_codon:yes stop_codon:yes gene_type:complete